VFLDKKIKNIIERYAFAGLQKVRSKSMSLPFLRHSSRHRDLHMSSNTCIPNNLDSSLSKVRNLLSQAWAEGERRQIKLYIYILE